MLHETQKTSSEAAPDAADHDQAAIADGADGVEEALGAWLVVIYHVPAEPSSARTAVWRELRRLGALSLQHAVCLLPNSEHNRAAYARLSARIEGYGGEATVLETRSPDTAWQDKIIARFNAARDEEYEEVVDETERFHEEIARERRKGKFTFAELEDEESNLERLRKYLAQVKARDAFGAVRQARASAEVERCAVTLDIFAQEIYDRQEGHTQANERVNGRVDDGSGGSHA
jgi:hypothetical protein